MAVIQPITQAGGIDGQEHGTPAIKNTAQGIFPQGIESGTVGEVILTDKAQESELNFRQPEREDTNKNRLDFPQRKALIITQAGNIDACVFGNNAIKNTATSIITDGMNNGDIGKPYIASHAIDGDLPFTQREDINKNRLDFPIKKALIISQVGGIDSQEFGKNESKSPLAICPQSHSIDEIGNHSITNHVIDGDLNFRQPENEDSNKNRLDFPVKTALIISQAGGIDGCSFGNETIDNTAASIRSIGKASDTIGNHSILASTPPLIDNQNPAVSVDLRFSYRYMGTNAQNIPLPFNEAKTIRPQGLMGEIGNASIQNRTQYINAGDINPPLMPLPAVQTHSATQNISPNSIVGEVGNPTISKGNTNTVHVGGIDAYQNAINEAIENKQTDGHQIKGKTQVIKADGIETLAMSPKHWVSNAEREVLHQGNNQATIGKALIDYGRRAIDLNQKGIEPPTIHSNAHKIGTSQTVTVQGFEATEWLTRIILVRQTLNAIGWDSQSKGAIEEQQNHVIGNKTQYIHANDDMQGEVGKIDNIYNLTQRIATDGIQPLSDTDATYHEKRHKINNANRNIATYGIDSEKQSKQHTIKNTAKRIDANGFNADEFGTDFIAYHTRKINAQSIESGYISRFNAIYNSAKAIYVVGTDEATLGQPEKIENTRRYYRWITASEQTEFGTPFIAYRVRKTTPSGIKPEYIDKPTIDNSDQYIKPDGMQGEAGKAEVKETRNIIKVSAIQHGNDNVGYPERVHNFNKEMHRAGGFDSSEFGNQTSIDNLTKYITIQNGISGVVSKPIYIGDNTQRLPIGGLFTEKQSDKHTVIQGVSPPYATQQVILNEIRDGNDKIYSPSNGIAPPVDQVGMPKITDNAIRHTQNNAFTAYGTPTILNNAIKIVSGIYSPFDIGTPFVKHNQIIGVEKGIEPPTNQVPKISLSPHTIYAPSSDMASEQARANHSTGQTPKPIAPMAFGTVSIENKNRVITQYSMHDEYHYLRTIYGTAKIYNSNNIIHPNGWKSERFGVAILPNTPQTIEQPTRNTKEYSEYGNARISIAEERNKTIHPKGITEQHGKTEIQNFNREITAIGIDSLQMGASNKQDKLNMPQTLWIGFPIPTNIEGVEYSEWGNARISNWIQEITINGEDTLQMRYDRTKFQDRMRVKRLENKPPDRKPPLPIKPQGITGTMPMPHIHNKTQVIRPDGDSDQYRKGAF